MRPSDWDVLDLSGDPTPGDPTVVSGLAREWDSVADDAEAAERGVRSLASDGAVLSWLGAAGEVFKSAIGEFPGQLGKCKDSYRRGASALRSWSSDLAGAQGDADRALELGRAARADLHAAQAALGSAQSSASAAAGSASSAQQVAAKYADSPPPAGVQVPNADAVRSAVRTAQVAQSRVSDAQAAVGDAQSRLDAARRMALDAKQLRESRGKVAAGKIQDASHAGIKPNSFLEDLGNLAGKVWDAVISVAKVVVAVLGIVALIIGGPIAWIVFAAAVLILADTIAKALQGKASWWEVAFAALGCIPGTKGLTTFKALSGVFKEAGTLAAAVHVLGAGRTALVSMAKGLRSLPSDLHLALGVGRKSWAEARQGLEYASVRVPTLSAGGRTQLAGAAGLDGPLAAMSMQMRSVQLARPGSVVRQGVKAASEAAQTFGTVRTAQMVKNADGTYDVVFRYNSGWDDFQRASADAKADALTDAGVQMPHAPTPRGSGTTTFGRQQPVDMAGARHAVPYDRAYRYDIDHRVDLQVGGADRADNMWWLESGVNRSEGAQLAGLLKRHPVPPGSEFNSFTFVQRGHGPAPDVLSLTGHVVRNGQTLAAVVR